MRESIAAAEATGANVNPSVLTFESSDPRAVRPLVDVLWEWSVARLRSEGAPVFPYRSDGEGQRRRLISGWPSSDPDPVLETLPLPPEYADDCRDGDWLQLGRNHFVLLDSGNGVGASLEEANALGLMIEVLRRSAGHWFGWEEREIERGAWDSPSITEPAGFRLRWRPRGGGAHVEMLQRAQDHLAAEDVAFHYVLVDQVDPQKPQVGWAAYSASQTILVGRTGASNLTPATLNLPPFDTAVASWVASMSALSRVNLAPAAFNFGNAATGPLGVLLHEMLHVLSWRDLDRGSGREICLGPATARPAGAGLAPDFEVFKTFVLPRDFTTVGAHFAVNLADLWWPLLFTQSARWARVRLVDFNDFCCGRNAGYGGTGVGTC